MAMWMLLLLLLLLLLLVPYRGRVTVFGGWRVGR